MRYGRCGVQLDRFPELAASAGSENKVKHAQRCLMSMSAPCSGSVRVVRVFGLTLGGLVGACRGLRTCVICVVVLVLLLFLSAPHSILPLPLASFPSGSKHSYPLLSFPFPFPFPFPLRPFSFVPSLLVSSITVAYPLPFAP